MSCMKACLGVLFPYIGVFIEKKCDQEYWINCVFSCCCGVAILHYFSLNEVDLITSLMCLIFPPFAAYLIRKDYCTVMLNIFLCMLLMFPGMIHAYYLALEEKAKVY